MIKLENTEVFGWKAAIRGMRNPMNSWEKSDSGWCPNGTEYGYCYADHRKYCPRRTTDAPAFCVGPNDHDLMMRLAKGGPVHAKYRRMIVVYVDITAPLYWWKEFDTYKVGTVANSCSTMHKIADKEFTLEDFSCEHLTDIFALNNASNPLNVMEHTIFCLNFYRDLYLKEKDKKYWWQMIQLLPSSYNQKRTIMLNYEVLAGIYQSRKNHKLDEWSRHEGVIDGDKTNKSLIGFCDWIETLPYSEIITMKNENHVLHSERDKNGNLLRGLRSEVPIVTEKE